MIKVSGVILAAGRSSRLGRPKQLLLLDGEPIIRITTRNALESRLDEVVLVIGAEAGAVASVVGDLGQRTVINREYALGQSTSLRLGLAAISPNADGIMFLLGDQPEVEPENIDALIEAFERTGGSIVQPAYGGVAGNPVLFARSHFGELASITGDEGARSLMKCHSDEILKVKVSDGPPPGDVDTEADYEELVARWGQRSGESGPGLEVPRD